MIFKLFNKIVSVLNTLERVDGVITNPTMDI